MCNELFKRNNILQVMAIVIVLSMSGPAFALDHFWTGEVSTDAADPRNWDNGTGTPTLPSSDDIVRIGTTSAWADYVPMNQPVLTSEWNGRNGGPKAGWWFVLGVENQNTLTIGDGAYIEFSHNDCNLRHGDILHVTGRRSDGGPSLVIPPRLRIANHGDSYPNATGTLRIDNDGYVRFDPSVATEGSGGYQIYMGALANALIEILDNGILELVNGTHRGGADIVTPRFVFGSSDPAANRIVISGNGQLLLAGDPPTGLVADVETSLEDMVFAGLITTDEAGGILTINGTSPTVVKLAERRITNPSPEDGRPDVAQQVILSWDPGTLAAQHDVYFGTDSANVGDANRANPLDVLKSQDQVETTYPLTGMLSLDFGQRYYWRVDEVNALSDPSIYKGDLWSFTVESFAIPIPGLNITATASSHLVNQEPEKTIDGSGLVGDLHSTVLEDMWISQAGEPGSAWIMYEFDKVYKLYEMLVWNYNGQSLLRSVGLKDVVVEYSSDGTNWTQIDSVSEFAQATGTDDYAHNTTVTFNGLSAKYVKINAHSNWGGGFINQFGLSEVRFLHIPVSARMPIPDDGATEVAIDVSLSWRAGREAAEHSVYLNADEQSVIDATVSSVTVFETSYGPLSLDLGSVYYWRVDEVNNAETITTWQGDIWSFTTQEYLVVDDFESYNDVEAGQEGSNLVYETWVDGFLDPANGSTMGYVTGKSLETLIIHGGKKSVPVMYDNREASLSEVMVNTSDLAIGPDWTIGSPEVLVLWVYGDPDNPATDQMYVKLNSAKVIFNGDLAQADWQEFPIDLASLGIDLSNVTELTIGFERTGVTGGSGRVFVDDIALYSPVVIEQ